MWWITKRLSKKGGHSWFYSKRQFTTNLFNPEFPSVTQNNFLLGQILCHHFTSCFLSLIRVVRSDFFNFIDARQLQQETLLCFRSRIHSRHCEISLMHYCASPDDLDWDKIISDWSLHSRCCWIVLFIKCYSWLLCAFFMEIHNYIISYISY